MAGKIWYYDCYDLRKYKPGEINIFIDIGANNGTTSLQAKVLNPTARVIAIEPCKETFDILQTNMEQWLKTGIECYNIALGDGKPMYFQKRRQNGLNRFFTHDETIKWSNRYGYTVESKTIKQIFEDYKISKDEPYILKIDCEGGERFLIQEEYIEYFLDIIKNSVQTIIEIHMGLGGNKKQWNSVFNSLKDTHELRISQWENKKTPNQKWVFKPYKEMPYERGLITIELMNKKWTGY